MPSVTTSSEYSASPNVAWKSAGFSRFALPPLSRATAEGALAKLWLCLEEHGLRTPNLDVELEANDRIRLTVTMADPEQAAILLKALASAGVIRAKDSGPGHVDQRGVAASQFEAGGDAQGVLPSGFEDS
jgi:hypothetical protein